jgi:primosomal protein N' (replication factor Y)
MGEPGQPLVARVLPDPPAIDKVFDYLVPAELRTAVAVGSEVRIDLHGRRVGGWVVALGADPPAGVDLRPLAKLRGRGPSAELVELAAWAAWRWAGRQAHFLATASPPAAVRELPPPAPAVAPVTAPGADAEAVDAVFARRGEATVVRVAPSSDRFGLLAAALSRALHASEPRSALVVSPSVDEARRLAARLDRAGVPVAVVTADRAASRGAAQWARAAAGGRVVVGARAAAFAPAPGLALGVVLDEHDQAHQSERSPTWHARDVVVERCRRAGAPALLLSPCPSLEALERAQLVVPPRAVERAGWPVVELVDRRREDPHLAASLISPRLVEVLRASGRVVCVLNRTGRARLLACRACDELARCEICGAAVEQSTSGDLTCRRCGAVRPLVCSSCGGTSFKVLRPGVSRLREELEAVAGEPVVEVVGTRADAADGGPDPRDARLVVGTEAALHRAGRSDVVAFCDFDQELLAPRLRAGEDALALLARAARLVGGRRGADQGRLLVQTRLPAHPVLRAALHADPGPFAAEERRLRAALELPPATALAALSGAGAETYAEALDSARAGAPVSVLGPDGGVWLVRAPDHRTLCDALARVPRPAARLRVEVDPRRV